MRLPAMNGLQVLSNKHLLSKGSKFWDIFSTIDCSVKCFMGVLVDREDDTAKLMARWSMSEILPVFGMA